MPMHFLTDHNIKEIYQPVLRGQLSQTQRNFNYFQQYVLH